MRLAITVSCFALVIGGSLPSMASGEPPRLKGRAVQAASTQEEIIANLWAFSALSHQDQVRLSENIIPTIIPYLDDERVAYVASIVLQLTDTQDVLDRLLARLDRPTAGVLRAIGEFRIGLFAYDRDQNQMNWHLVGEEWKHISEPIEFKRKWHAARDRRIKWENAKGVLQRLLASAPDRHIRDMINWTLSQFENVEGQDGTPFGKKSEMGRLLSEAIVKLPGHPELLKSILDILRTHSAQSLQSLGLSTTLAKARAVRMVVDLLNVEGCGRGLNEGERAEVLQVILERMATEGKSNSLAEAVFLAIPMPILKEMEPVVLDTAARLERLPTSVVRQVYNLSLESDSALIWLGGQIQARSGSPDVDSLARAISESMASQYLAFGHIDERYNLWAASIGQVLMNPNLNSRNRKDLYLALVLMRLHASDEHAVRDLGFLLAAFEQRLSPYDLQRLRLEISLAVTNLDQYRQ